MKQGRRKIADGEREETRDWEKKPTRVGMGFLGGQQQQQQRDTGFVEVVCFCVNGDTASSVAP